MHSELFVSRAGGLTWAVLREDDITVELSVEDGGAATVGWIVKARVTRVLPGIQSAFLDTGMSRAGFLHVSDLLLPDDPAPGGPGGELAVDPEDLDGEAEARTVTAAAETARAPIEQRLRAGDDLLVQVARDALAAKGARLTCHCALPGRYLVYLPRVEHLGVSRRIPEPEERERLRSMLERLPRSGGGFIVRTAGRGVDEALLRADAELLVESWEGIVRAAARAKAPAVLHRDLGLPMRVLRDLSGAGLRRIVVDDPGDRERAAAYLGRVDPDLAGKVELHRGPPPLLEAHGLDADIERALQPRVRLASGGHLVIEPTEALVSIDVNTGRFVGGRGPAQTVVQTNLEAAREIARQLRLRDLGGIVVIDFIDMSDPEDRRRVIDALQQALHRDRARTKIVGLSELGLLQLTRKRTRDSLVAQLTRPCAACAGRGRIKAPQTVVAEAIAELERVLPALDGQTVTVRVHPDVARLLRLALQTGAGRGLPREGRLRVEDDPASLPDRFDVVVW